MDNFPHGRHGLIHRPTPSQITRLGAFLNNPAPARAVDWLGAVATRLEPLGNLTKSCCVPAGLLHAIQWRTAAAWSNQWDPTDNQCDTLYSAISDPHYDPVTGVNDNGCQVDTAMAYVATRGVRIASQFLDLTHPVSVAPDPVHQQMAIEACGWVGWSLALPLAANDMNGRFDVAGDGPAWEPGSGGDHFVPGGAYDTGVGGSVMFRCVTWGRVWEMSPAFLDRYLLRADSGWSNDWLMASGVSASGLDRLALEQAAGRLVG